MSMKADVPGALRDLACLLDRIAELIEWERLAQQERKQANPSSFQLPNHFQQELNLLQASFFNLVFQVNEALARPDLEASADQLRRWKRRLAELDDRMSRLDFAAKLIKP